jgi:chromosome segregation ATPase
MNMKEILAKLLLGKDVRLELANVEKTNNDMISKLKTANYEVENLTKEADALNEILIKSEHSLAGFKEELHQLNDIISENVSTVSDTDGLTILQNTLEKKKNELAVIENELNKLEKDMQNLTMDIAAATKEKSNLQKEFNKLAKDQEELDKKINEAEKEKDLIARKLSQRKEILEKLKVLKDQWQHTLEDFRSKIDKPKTEDLHRLKKELNDYERNIQNLIEIK